MLKAFRVVFLVVLGTIALELDKVFVLSMYYLVRKDLLDFVFGLVVDDVGWW